MMTALFDSDFRVTYYIALRLDVTCQCGLNYLPLKMSNLIACRGRHKTALTHLYVNHLHVTVSWHDRRYALYSPATLSLVSHALSYPPLFASNTLVTCKIYTKIISYAKIVEC